MRANSAERTPPRTVEGIDYYMVSRFDLVQKKKKKKRVALSKKKKKENHINCSHYYLLYETYSGLFILVFF